MRALLFYIYEGEMPMPHPLRRKRHKEETIARILEAGAKLFQEKGYARTSVEDICQHAGVSKGGFYWHFSGKKDVYLSMLTRAIDALIQEKDRLKESVRGRSAHIRYLLQSTAYHRFRLLRLDAADVWSAHRHDMRFAESLRQEWMRYHDVWRDLLFEGIIRQEFQPVDIEQYTYFLIALIEGLEREDGTLTPQRREALLERGIRFFLQSLQTNPLMRHDENNKT